MSIKNQIIVTLRRFPVIKRVAKDAYQLVGNLVSDRKSWPDTIRQLSSNDGEHLFGYYDKTPWNSRGDAIYLRVRQADTQVASSKAADIVVNKSGKQEQIVAQTHAWNVQQGCMLQWYAGNDDIILYNDFRDSHLCSIIKDLVTGHERVLEVPLYSVSKDGKNALTLDFTRLHTLRPGYGYCNLPDATQEQHCPNGFAIQRLNIENNSLYPLYTYKELAELRPLPSMRGAYHKVNHIMISPSGESFMFLHRWIQNGQKYDRLLWAPIDGARQPVILLDEGMVSHSNWRDESTIITYANALGRGPGYCLIDVPSKVVTDIASFFPDVDGHPSYAPDRRYVITDTYPDFSRKHALYLIDMEEKQCRKIASIYASGRYRNETRCDLHPRWSPDGRQISFDACKDGIRQVYEIKVP